VIFSPHRTEEAKYVVGQSYLSGSVLVVLSLWLETANLMFKVKPPEGDAQCGKATCGSGGSMQAGY
jgi:hypothetical protein